MAAFFQKQRHTCSQVVCGIATLPDSPHRNLWTAVTPFLHESGHVCLIWTTAKTRRMQEIPKKSSKPSVKLTQHHRYSC